MNIRRLGESVDEMTEDRERATTKIRKDQTAIQQSIHPQLNAMMRTDLPLGIQDAGSLTWPVRHGRPGSRSFIFTLK